MPNGDMHLWGAEQVLKNIKLKRIKKVIEENQEHYFLGAVIPDSFIYFIDQDLHHYLHGDTKKDCSNFVKTMLKNKSDKNKAFVYGFITHCAFDGTWHPVVNYFAGNYKERPFAIYNHFLYETHLALHYSLEKPWTYIKPELIRDTGVVKLELKRIKINLYIHKIVTSLLQKKWVYESAYFLSKLRLFPRRAISLFQHHVLRDHRCFKNGEEYRDLITGKISKVNYKDLNLKAVNLAISMIKEANRTGTCKGFNLATGRKSKTISDAKYFKL